MKIAIMGVGAVGGYFGGRLAAADEDVYFIARGSHLAKIREHGLRVDSEYGDFVAHPTFATDNPAEVGEVDVVVVATKAWHIESAAVSIRPMVGANTVIIPLLNGVEAPQKLATVLGAEKVLGGFCRIQANKQDDGYIVQNGTPPFVAFGELNGEVSERVQLLRAVFEAAGITMQVPENIMAAMWQKLLFIAAFGGVGAVTRMPVGVIRALPETRAMLEDAMQEAYTVALASGIPMADDAVANALSLVDAFPDESTASMQRDIMNGYPSELDAQNGAVVRAGIAVNVPTPTHRFIYHSLLPSEKKARGEL
jgi:2-dehydropantoate 2-reductase